MSDNSANSKRIAKNTLMLYFRMLFMMGISLYTSRIVLKTLEVEDYGIYNVVGGVVTMFGFINSSMAASTQRFLTFVLEKGDKKKLNETFSTSLIIHLAISIIVIIFAETIGLWFLYNKMVIPIESIDAAVWVYHFAILSSIVMILSVPYNAVIISHEKMGAFAYISILEGILKLLIVFLLPVLGFNRLKLYALLMFLTQLIIRMCYGLYCKRFKETKFKLAWNKRQFKEMATFAFWTMNGNLAVVGYTQGLNILLNMFFNPAVNAARAIAVQVQGTALNFCRNFQIALNPQITKSYSREDYSYMHKLIYTSSTYSFYLLLFLTLPIILNAEYILTIWLGVVPEYTVNFVRLSLLIGLINAVANPIKTAVHATGRLKVFQIWEGCILLTIVPISYFMLKQGHQPEIVFIVHLVVAILAQIASVIIICPMIKMAKTKYLKNVALKCLIVLVLSPIIPSVVYLYLPYGLLGFFLTSITCVLSVLAVVYLNLPNSDKKFAINKCKQLLRLQ